MNLWTFIFAVIALSTIAGLVSNWIRAKHGYPLEDEEGGSLKSSEVKELRTENAELQAKLSAMSERVRVLERIATDPAERTAREIEQLR